jgi:predicted MFS family arabinose efflux permease
VLSELKEPTFRRMLALNFAFMFLFTSFEFTVTFFYKIDFGLMPSQIGLVFFYLGLLLALGQGVLVRRLSGKISEQSMIVAGVILIAFALPLLALSSPSVPLSLLALAPVAIGSSLLQPAMAGLASRSISADRQGLAMGSFRSMGSLARGVGPVFGSYVYGSMGITVTYIVIGALLLVSFAVGAGTLRTAQSEASRT